MKRTLGFSRNGIFGVAVAAVLASNCRSPGEISLLDKSADARASGTGGSAGRAGGQGQENESATDAAREMTGRGCTTAADCSSSEPFCDAKSGGCVECVTDSNCPTYLCDSEHHVCAGCSKDADCHAKTPHCDGDDRRCVQCRSPADCAVGEACVAEAHACAVRCVLPGDCAGSNRPICAAAAGVCVECTNNADCVQGNRPPLCDLRIGSCVECLRDADCPTGRCTAREPRCVDCLSSADCPNGKACRGYACVP